VPGHALGIFSASLASVELVRFNERAAEAIAVLGSENVPLRLRVLVPVNLRGAGLDTAKFGFHHFVVWWNGYSGSGNVRLGFQKDSLRPFHRRE
jgi:hypothetical protein